MTPEVHSDIACALGEGPLWHPLREQLFWFDILGHRMHCDNGEIWQFNEHVSAAGWIDRDTLLIASENSLLTFNLVTGDADDLCPLEDDDPNTRSNDGRTDPWGGFWIGTMRKDARNHGGAIYRYYKGALEQLYAPVSITNGIAFAPDRSCAYWADTASSKVFRVLLDDDGWPRAAPNLFLDMAEHGLNPDGSIVAADGSYLNAQWGASRVSRYTPDGSFMEAIRLPTSHVTCPALGGPDLSTLFVTSAQEGLTRDQLEAEPKAGQTFRVDVTGHIKGLPEYQVKL